jgi:pre-60S factor REI1
LHHLTTAQQNQQRLSESQANYSQPCIPCKKIFYSQNAYTNHLSSKRHRLASLRTANRLSALKADDTESIAGSIGSGTISLDMVDSIASLDDVHAIQDGVDHMQLDDEVFSIPCMIDIG